MSLRAALIVLVSAPLAPAGEPIKLTGHTREVYAVAYSPTGEKVASASNDGTIRVWTLADGKAVAIKTGGASRTVAFSPDGKLVAGRFETGAALWDTAGERVALLPSPDPAKDSTVRRVAFSPDGKHLVAGHDAGLVRLWDVATRKPVADLARDGGVGELRFSITTLAFSPDGKLLAAGSGSGLVVWNVETRKAEKTLSASAKTFSAAFTPDGKRLLVNEENRVGGFSVWNVADWTKAAAADRGAAPEQFLSAIAPIDDSRALGVNERDQFEYYDLLKYARTKAAFATPCRYVADGFAISPDRKAVAHFSGGNIYAIYVEPLPAAK